MVNQLWARTMRSWRVLLPTAVVLAGVTGAAIAGPVTKGAPKGVTAYINHGNGALPNHGSGYLPQNIWPPPGVLVAAVSVPAGNFVANAKIRLRNDHDGASASGKCSLRINQRTIDAMDFHLPERGASAALSLQGTSSSSAKKGFSLWCANFNAPISSKKVFAESQVLTAVRVSKVDEQ